MNWIKPVGAIDLPPYAEPVLCAFRKKQDFKHRWLVIASRFKTTKAGEHYQEVSPECEELTLWELVAWMPLPTHPDKLTTSDSPTWPTP